MSITLNILEWQQTGFISNMSQCRLLTKNKGYIKSVFFFNQSSHREVHSTHAPVVLQQHTNIVLYFFVFLNKDKHTKRGTVRHLPILILLQLATTDKQQIGIAAYQWVLVFLHSLLRYITEARDRTKRRAGWGKKKALDGKLNKRLGAFLSGLHHLCHITDVIHSPHTLSCTHDQTASARSSAVSSCSFEQNPPRGRRAVRLWDCATRLCAGTLR